MARQYSLEPKVDAVGEFLEITRDFTNPLEAVREAISNSFDAHAEQIRIHFSADPRYGESDIIVEFQDDGDGMDESGLRSFFDLGNSLRRTTPGAIGKKGHGTKVFFNCERLDVETVGPDGITRRAQMMRPLNSLYEHNVPAATVEEGLALDIKKGTRVRLKGFNKNRTQKFTHEQLRDYVLWFTKFGSIEKEFDIHRHNKMTLELKGIDRTEPETISFGHVFPPETKNHIALFEEHLTDAPKHFVKKWVREGHLPNRPDQKYQAVFYIEGDKAKRSYNPMLTVQGRKAVPGSYKVTDRYGLYLCRDFIPIERTVGWLGARSTDHLMFHAFINCQGLELTANRGSVANTPLPILDDLRSVVEVLRNEIASSPEYADMAWLQGEAASFETANNEQIQFKKRCDFVRKQQTATFKGMVLREPRQESGVLALVAQISALEPKAFPFEMIDYDTSVGIDALAKVQDAVQVGDGALRYLEFKYRLERTMNHSFKHIHSIVTWDLHPSLKKEQPLEDLAGEQRVLHVVPPDQEGERTHYYLDARKSPHKIEVFVLKKYLQETLGINFA